MVIEQSDSWYMQKALEQAQYATEADEVPVGCIIVQQGQILTRNYNLTEAQSDPTAHAELISISSVCNHLQSRVLPDATVYITLEPCAMCAGALYWARPKKVVFGSSDIRRGYRALGMKLHPKTEVVSGILENECSQILKEYFKNKR